MALSLKLLEQLFDHLPLGIVALDASGRVVVFNRTEELLAGRKREQVLGRQFFIDVAPCMNVRQLAGEFAERIGRAALDVNVEFSFPFPFLAEPRDVRVHMSSFEVDAEPHALMMIEDVSAQRSVERMKATLHDLLVHDLKNPLAAMSSNLEYLRSFDSIRDSQDAMEAISDSLNASKRLQGMLLTLLDITRLETNSFPLQPVETALDDLLSEIVAGNSAQAKMHGAEITVHSPVRLRASIDASVMRRALDNLVENGLRHAKHISLSAHRTSEGFFLQVEDDGPGVPEAIRAAIFEKYAQVKDAKASSSGYNRGLGLTFVRLAARAHGGDASVECPSSGGSVFRISFPRELPRSSTRP